MTTPLIIAIIAATLINLLVLLWLVRTHLQLKRNFKVVKQLLQGMTNDIAGLCSAAVAVDNRIVTTDEQLNALLARISEFQKNEPELHPYSLDIQKVRSGASIGDLMQSSGLSHDEAALLIRLHGSKKPA
jgi:H+/gluconate symporter-like permease